MIGVLRKYSGVLFFYLAIVGMILIINARFESMNKPTDTVTYAMSK